MRVSAFICVLIKKWQDSAYIKFFISFWSFWYDFCIKKYKDINLNFKKEGIWMKKTFIIILFAALPVFFATLSAYALLTGLSDKTECVQTDCTNYTKEGLVNFNLSDGSGFSSYSAPEPGTDFLFGISLIAMATLIKMKRSKKMNQAQIPLQTCMLCITRQSFDPELKQHSNLKV